MEGLELREDVPLRNEETASIIQNSRIPEDLAIALDTALDVNRHLNSQVEGLIREVDSLKGERDAAVEHARHLSKKLSQARREGKADRGIQGLSTGGALLPTDSLDDNYEEDQDDGEEEHCRGAVLGYSREEWNQLREKGASNGWLVDPEKVRDSSSSALDLDRTICRAQSNVTGGSLRSQTLLLRGALSSVGREDGPVDMGPEVGRGNFGTTHEAFWRGSKVALKKVRVESEEQAVSFLREVEVLSCVRHPCLLPFIGAVLNPPEQCFILSEWMPGGTLKTWIHGDQGKGIPAARHKLSACLQKALEVACGLQALQEMAPPVLHRDIKPSNILVDGSGVARVADMGLARRSTPGNAGVLTGETGTYLYMAPEVMQHDPYDTKADVYSWAILTSELITQQVPFAEQFMTPLQVAMAVCNKNLRPRLPESLHPGVSKLLRTSWDTDPSKRPLFREVAGKMRKFVEHVLLDEQDQEEAQHNPIGNFMRGMGWGPRPRLGRR